MWPSQRAVVCRQVLRDLVGLLLGHGAGGFESVHLG